MAGFELAIEDEGGEGEFLWRQIEGGAEEDFGRPALVVGRVKRPRPTLTSKTSRPMSSNTEVGKNARSQKFVRTTNSSLNRATERARSSRTYRG
jgi:hypothetical protein